MIATSTPGGWHGVRFLQQVESGITLIILQVEDRIMVRQNYYRLFLLCLGMVPIVAGTMIALGVVSQAATGGPDGCRRFRL